MENFLDSSAFMSKRINGALSWFFSLFLLATGFNILLDGSILWSFYVFVITLFAVLPVLVKKDWMALPPFEILFFLTIPFTLRSLETGLVASYTLSYLSAAGVALLLVTALDTYTSFRTTERFAVVLVALTTIAISGVWAVARWLSDIYLGTGFIVSEDLLMWEFTASFLAGLVSGKLFGYYFRKRDRRLRKYED